LAKSSVSAPAFFLSKTNPDGFVLVIWRNDFSTVFRKVQCLCFHRFLG
jgi:hypothetical protein